MCFKDEKMLSTGRMSLAPGVLLLRFVQFEYSGFSVSDFVGVLIGPSLVMNLTYMIKQLLKKYSDKHQIINHGM
jgi:hypothetical protein